MHCTHFYGVNHGDNYQERQALARASTQVWREQISHIFHAKKWAEMLEKQIESGKYNEIPDITLDELIDKYLKEVTVTKRGKREERIRLLRLSRTPLAAISLQEIGKAHFREWQNQRLKEVSTATVLRERSSLSAVMNKAIEWDFITDPP